MHGASLGISQPGVAKSGTRSGTEKQNGTGNVIRKGYTFDEKRSNWQETI